MSRRVRKRETCPAGLGGGNMSLRVREGETCPAGLGRGSMQWGLVGSGKVRLIWPTDIRQNGSIRIDYLAN